ncbi:uncharacterized protein GIQ15_05389 [Arthroderma uncinatum]|uniref:uncharacterized protein n=1 Tax=Arthroderma uncinatum TaxID=74035 RepID=UPI00144A508C|nr:uncharacterized protein GIQ15_06382 [Arthroderma uncinatum]XP_033403950.1 uncharacterized protein GIQ15_05389 [Arthroderma uncinatum]KAF3479406.1 hypothetical protein GIQ15_06382 [Arthroderma uncinatum]KAF3480042.1 hypothetical protein GIQ15_05389 [Arthroderma uncinatum]
MTLSREKSEDLETQADSVIRKFAYNRRLEFIQLLFDVKPEILTSFPGIESYCHYLEHDAFPSLMDPAFGLIWELISCTKTKEITDCWDWSVAVLRLIQSESPEVSIDDIAECLDERSGASKTHIRAQETAYLYIAIFGVLCWSSLAMRPRLIFTDSVPSNFACLLPNGVKSTSTPSTNRLNDRCKRPLMTIFRAFKSQNWGGQSRERIVDRSRPRETDSLYEASLNIYSLRYFGHVSIQWTDTISEHLRFNPANRRLSLFRFPTFCALLATHGDNVFPVIQSVYEQLDPLSPEEKDQCCVSLAQEIILSYRLLFGQDGKSRKVAREEICKLKNSSADQVVDRMLSDLCECKYERGSRWWKTYDTTLQSYPSEIWPITCRTMEGQLQQSDVYSSRGDFPRLGPRLIRLQQFNTRQRPSKLTDLWCDRRNPLQWYTFWAVLLVGGAANILAALQLLVSIAALKF